MTRKIIRDPRINVELFNVGSALDNIRTHQRGNFTLSELVELEHASQSIQRVNDSIHNLPGEITEVGG
jgi:hypothetical protein